MQLVKGGFSFQLNKNLKAKGDIWQPSFADRRVRDSLEYAKYKGYIWQNPVKRGLVRTPEEYPYSSAHPYLSRQTGSGTSAAKADFSISVTADLPPHSRARSARRWRGTRLMDRYQLSRTNEALLSGGC
jgi:hypothetical protein